MSETYVVETTFNYKYTTHEPIPIPDVIDSLKSMEKLLRRTPVFIERRFKDVSITETDVFVERLETGSLDLDFLIKFVFKTDERAERAKEIAQELMQEKGVVRDLVAVGVGAMLMVGANQIFSPGKDAAPANSVTAYQSVVIQAGANVGLDQEAMKEAIKKIPDQKSLGKDAFNVLKPATQDREANIEVPGMPAISIDRDIIDKLPEHYEAPMPSEKSATYPDATVLVYASDRDNHDKGWAGSVPNVVDNRVRFVLDDSINPAEWHGTTRLQANIRVTERYVPSRKKYEIKEVEILEILN